MDFTFHSPSLESTLTAHRNKDGILNFRGISFASISQRWAHSTLDTNLPYSFDATNYGPKCPQPNDSPLVSGGATEPAVGDDELKCLNLNITVHEDNFQGRLGGRGLPVIVWVHGGSFKTGSNSIARYNPDRLSLFAKSIGKPVVIVLINYRLGVFSFIPPSHLSPLTDSSSTSQSGDLGIADQQHAFQWVQNHIPDFGGDPMNVTAVGISAGSASLHHHLLYGEPLFDRAVLMSGLEPLIGRHDGEVLNESWNLFIKNCGLEKQSAKEQLQTLRSLNAQELIG